MGIFWGILYAVSVALGRVALKRSREEHNSSIGFALETFFGVLIWIPFGILSGIEIHQLWQIAPIVFLSAILAEAYVFFMYTKGPASIVGTVLSTCSIFTLIFSLIFLHETISLFQILFILITIAGVIVIAAPAKLKRREWAHLQPILWATSGAIAAGFSDTISKHAIDDTSAGTFLFTLAFAQTLVAVGYLKTEKQTFANIRSIFLKPLKYKPLFLSALLIAVSMVFFWLAFESTFAGIASTITSTYIMFVVIFSRILLNERIPKQDLLGIGIVVAGVIGLGIAK